MSLSAVDGLAVVYSLMCEWEWRRDVLTVLGVDDPDRVDTILGR